MPAKSRPGLTFSATRKAAPKEAPSDDADRIFISARIPSPTYRQFKSYAAEKGRKVQDVMEEALTEYLAAHR
jgi:hypothetical protein